MKNGKKRTSAVLDVEFELGEGELGKYVLRRVRD